MLRNRKISISQALTITMLAVAVQAFFAQILARSNPIGPSESASQSADIHLLVPDAQISAAIRDLCTRHLLIPVDGVPADALRGSFYEMRGSSAHEATDIPAPRNTPVRAVEDGTIAKLFFSRFGGNTIYQTDPTGQYVYYYAHLEKYQPTLKEGDRVKRGQTIGFVGTSGNAPPNTPHLHFSISVLTKEKKWWQARALDPYEVFKSDKAKSQ
ncbi:MAG: M23 family metallopeptidase [Candidatus Obscuribacterales bacterium]|nr:M23 family metallopeptidase [Candidatus Obscuribacterales bacterium]